MKKSSTDKRVYKHGVITLLGIVAALVLLLLMARYG